MTTRDETLTEIARVMNQYKMQDEIKIRTVDYWQGTEQIEASGSIAVSILLEELAKPKNADYLDDISEIYAENLDDEVKLDAIIAQTPAMYDEGVLGVTLDI